MDTPVLDAIITTLEGEVPKRAIFGALKRLEGEFKYRIHTEGKDANGDLLGTFAPKRLGRYSFYYAKFRQREGRRIDRKDLEVLGNLRKSYTVGTYKNGHALGFLYDRARLIAEGQQRQTRTIIFAPTPTERATLLELISDNIL